MIPETTPGGAIRYISTGRRVAPYASSVRSTACQAGRSTTDYSTIHCSTIHCKHAESNTRYLSAGHIIRGKKAGNGTDLVSVGSLLRPAYLEHATEAVRGRCPTEKWTSTLGNVRQDRAGTSTSCGAQKRETREKEPERERAGNAVRGPGAHRLDLGARCLFLLPLSLRFLDALLGGANQVLLVLMLEPAAPDAPSLGHRPMLLRQHRRRRRRRRDPPRRVMARVGTDRACRVAARTQ